MEYIERDAVIKKLCDYGIGWGEARVKGVIHSIPAADVRPVVHGRNKLYDYPSLFECSICGWSCYDTIPCDSPYNFCPNCGADIREKNND